MKKTALIYLPKPGQLGGIEIHTIRLARLLSEQDYQVTYLATGNSLHQSLKQQLTSVGVNFHEIARPSSEVNFNLTLVFLIKFALKNCFKRWDLVYTNGHTSFSPFFWLFSRSKGVVIHHHHTSADVEEQKSWRSSYYWVLRNVPRLVACSSSTAKQLAQVAPKTRITYLPYLIDPALPASHVHSLDVLKVVYIGRLVKTKGIHLVLDLAHCEELSRIKWVIYGSLGEYEIADFQSIKTVEYRGVFVGKEGLIAALKDADALILLSDHCEGMPISLLEASSMGVPWIATDIGGVRELAETDSRNIVLPRRPDLATCKAAVLRIEQRHNNGKAFSSEVIRQPTPEFKLNFSYFAAASKWLKFIKNPVN